MRHSIRIGAAILGITALMMSGIALAQTVDAPDPSGGASGQPAASQVILEQLAPLVEDGTITEGQAAAVAEQLSPLVRRAASREQTRQLQRKLGRLAGEITEVLGISGDRLGEQLGQGMTLGEIAEANGSSGEQLITDVVDHVAAHLAVQVTAGRVDQARANEGIANTEKALTELIDVTHPFGTVIRERRTTAVRIAGLDAAAGALGLSLEDLRERLQDGNSLVAIAAEQGVEEDELIAAILGPIEQALDSAVARDRISEERAAEILDDAADRVAKAIHEVPGS